MNPVKKKSKKQKKYAKRLAKTRKELNLRNYYCARLYKSLVLENERGDRSELGLSGKRSLENVVKFCGKVFDMDPRTVYRSVSGEGKLHLFIIMI